MCVCGGGDVVGEGESIRDGDDHQKTDLKGISMGVA